MRPKLTWRVRRWSTAAWVDPLPAIAKQYGERIADVVEWHAHVVDDNRDRPSAQDRKHTLRAIAEAPATADLRHVDGYTEAALTTHAQRRYQCLWLADLTAEQLRDCALGALAEFRADDGRLSTDTVAVRLVADLLRAGAPADAVARDTLIADALRACHLGSSSKNIARLLTEAQRILQAGQVF